MSQNARTGDTANASKTTTPSFVRAALVLFNPPSTSAETAADTPSFAASLMAARTVAASKNADVAAEADCWDRPAAR